MRLVPKRASCLDLDAPAARAKRLHQPVEVLPQIADKPLAVDHLQHLDLAELAIQWAFVLVLGLGARATWRAGLRRFAAFGG